MTAYEVDAHISETRRIVVDVDTPQYPGFGLRSAIYDAVEDALGCRIDDIDYRLAEPDEGDDAGWVVDK